MEYNRQVASQLRQIAALLDEQEVPFKPNAYRRAAHVVEELPKDVSAYKSDKELMQLPGIGAAIAGKIREYVQTGRIRALDELLMSQGGLSAELMQVEDLGPKRVRQLEKELGIKTVPALIKAAEGGKLRSLPRMSALMEKKILGNAKRVAERSKRFLRTDVVKDVEKILHTIRGVKGVEKAEAGGSYRRGKETVGDIDLLVVTKKPKEVSDAIAALPFVREVVAHGERKLSFNLRSGLRADVRFVARSQWGSALVYFTGDKEHNIGLRKRAIGRGWKLNEYGLFDAKGRVIASREEKDIYQALGLPSIAPTQRNGVLPG